MPTCRLCNAGELTEVFTGKIRAGSFGKQVKDDYTAFRCRNCGIEFIYPEVKINYEDESYRGNFNEIPSIEQFHALHDDQYLMYLNLLTGQNFRHKVIADIGCAGGLFLDLASSIADETIAIEPNIGFQEHLKKNNDYVFSYLDDALEKLGPGHCDLVTCFHVIEHIDKPIEFIGQIVKFLKKGGSAYILTPNSRDILNTLDFPEFKPFYYRTVHQWYFNKTSFDYIANELKLENHEVVFLQSFDFSNFVSWLMERKPTGNGKLQMFDKTLELNWKNFLESNGMADGICLKITKA